MLKSKKSSFSKSQIKLVVISFLFLQIHLRNKFTLQKGGEVIS